jgi:hypothetical protein
LLRGYLWTWLSFNWRYISRYDATVFRFYYTGDFFWQGRILLWCLGPLADVFLDKALFLPLKEVTGPHFEIPWLKIVHNFRSLFGNCIFFFFFTFKPARLMILENEELWDLKIECFDYILNSKALCIKTVPE